MDGAVKKYDQDRGFGFIATSFGDDLFFHISKWTHGDDDLPEVGDRVSFDETEGRNGRRAAENVRRRP